MKEIIIKYETHRGKTIMDALAAEGLDAGGSCGGLGTCGKCRVVANGEPVLACHHQITSDVRVRIPSAKDDMTAKDVAVKLPEGFVPDKGEAGTYGIALDLGTTTVVVMLWNLDTGTLEDVEAVSNPQRVYGADVMSRIGFVLRAPWNLKRLQSSLVNEINQRISRLAMKHSIKLEKIQKIAVVGNTAMSHLFLGEDVSGLAAYPFRPAFTGSMIVLARMIGITAHEEAEVYVAPNMGGHVGSDITAGILAAGYLEEENRENRLFLDIGTNGEILLTVGNKAYCCSTAAGPAFEGGALHQGMRAVPGAICKVELLDGIVKTRTIGEAPAVGICGSGIIDAVATMIKCRAIDTFGRIEGEEEVNDFPLTAENEACKEVIVTQQDVREIQMAKAAIAAGSRMLLKKAGLSIDDVTEIGIAGAFGNAVHLESAKIIGLLPKVTLAKMHTLGNSAGIGASMMLLSEKNREKAEKIAAAVEHVELAASIDFQKMYIEEMNF